MKTIAFYNIKGGVGKTTSALAFAQILHDDYHKRVLFIDIDKQSNSSRALGVYEPDGLSTADLLTAKDVIVDKVIKHSVYGIDVIPASYHLVRANREVQSDVKRPQQMRFKKQLASVQDKYDYCIIDFPPDDNYAAINALVVTDDILIPIRFDRYALDGMEYVVNDLEDLRMFNDKLTLKGCFLTMYINSNLYSHGEEWLKNTFGFKFLNTHIRQTVKVGESSFDKPLTLYSPNSTAAQDYKSLVAEYLAMD